MEYVGKTDRNLEERIIEHATKHNQPSAVDNHIYSCDHFQYLYKIMSFFKLFHGDIWNKGLSFYRGGSSEARWWNPECVNTYKVSTLVCHRLHTKLYQGNYMGTLYIKFNLGITHCAHNYMETSHEASKPKHLKL